jgi:hypothetical protein
MRWLHLRSAGTMKGRIRCGDCGGVHDVKVEVKAFSLVCCTLLNVLVRKGKGPEGRKNLAQGASPGSRRLSGSRQPQRGERIRLRRGNSPWFCCPLRGLPGGWAWFPRARALG